MEPDDIEYQITKISRMIDTAELSRNPYDFIEARRMLNALKDRVEAEIERRVQERMELWVPSQTPLNVSR